MYVLGADLRRMRTRAEKTTTQMAEFAGVKTRKTYENWEKSNSSPDVNQFIDMAKGCGYDPAQLIQLFTERSNNSTPVDVLSTRVPADIA
ncbi:MAG: helix-turn-helix domain-containing protein [Alteromonadaceae bacterium]|nr:helix-turn-helix domain-containing protein [Alteromonadaceae bacterium]